MKIIDADNFRLFAEVNAYRSTEVRALLSEFVDCEGDVVFFEEDEEQVREALKTLGLEGAIHG